MYPFERYMGFLKGYVRNRYRLEASIIQGYVTEEVIEFCTDYMKDVPSIGVPQSRHEGRLQGVGTIGRNMEPPNRDDLYRAHFTVLEHMTCVAPYIHEHKTMLIAKNSKKTQAWVATEHYKTFPDWWNDWVGPRCGTKYQGYDINGFTFYTKQQDDKSTLQNSGVTLIAATSEFSMGDHEARSTIAKKSYYGVVQEIWELDYLSFTIPMLKCKWVNNEGGVKVDDYGFTSVNLSTNGYASEPFILAKQAKRIFFVKDPSDSRWHIVLHGKRRIVGVENVVDEDEYDKFDELPPFSIGASSSNDVIDDTTYLRSDHDEVGICANMEELMDEHDMVAHNIIEHDMNEQPEPQPQRKKRGIYILKKKNRKQLNGVTFDGHCLAIGKDQSPFALYVGAVTKAKISILIEDWRKVPKGDKTQLWLEIKEHCRLKNDDCKTQVLKQCNHSWKSFKKDLRTKYMYKKKSPCDKYTFIEPDIWEKFVKMESTPEKMAKHAQGKKWAKLKKNPPRLGPKGYRGNIDKWEKERASEELCTPVHKIPDCRGRNYCLARRVHDKVKGLMLSPEMQVIADKLIEAHTELSNSSEVEDGVDPLIMVEAREEMEAEYNERLATAINEMKSNQQNENPESPLMRKSSCDSASNFDEASKCQLFIPYGTNKVLCAIGMVYPSKQVHGKSVLQGHAKVHVDNVESNYKDYLLLVPTDEFSKIGETVLSFIQWPTKYIEHTKASNSNQTGNKKTVAANTSTQTVTKQTLAKNKEPSTLKQTFPTLSRLEVTSNHIAADPLTKSARPLNSV
ncbi:transposon protein, partial [Tanacetum coccineum]